MKQPIGIAKTEPKNTDNKVSSIVGQKLAAIS
jgi:hypothetical protein